MSDQINTDKGLRKRKGINNCNCYYANAYSESCNCKAVYLRDVICTYLRKVSDRSSLSLICHLYVLKKGLRS